jgi:23S rRNA (guanosine2251-2'-O)-methyltransferase
VSTDLVYGRGAVREALRGGREVKELLATERAAAAEPWLAEARPKLRPERELSELAGTRNHQGALARVEPYRYADAFELAALERALLVVLDRACDATDLGGLCRAAAGAGATGVVVPAGAAAVVTPAVARAAAGAIEHLPIAVVSSPARFLEEIKRPRLAVVGAEVDARVSMWEADLRGGLAVVLGGQGRTLRPLVRRSCDVLVAIPAGSIDSLGLAAAAAVILYEARRQREA